LAEIINVLSIINDCRCVGEQGTEHGAQCSGQNTAIQAASAKLCGSRCLCV